MPGGYVKDIFVPVWGVVWVGTALVQKAITGANHLSCPAHHLDDGKCPRYTDLPLLLSTSMNSPWRNIRCLSVVYFWMPGISLLYLFYSYCSKSSRSWKLKKPTTNQPNIQTKNPKSSPSSLKFMSPAFFIPKQQKNGSNTEHEM